MTHKYQEDDQVTLVEDHGEYLPVGSIGRVFCLYTTTPPAYEINFVATDGELIGNIFYEDEIEAVAEALPLVRREAVSAGL